MNRMPAGPEVSNEVRYRHITRWNGIQVKQVPRIVAGGRFQPVNQYGSHGFGMFRVSEYRLIVATHLT